MNLMTGEIVSIYIEEGMTMARVRVGGAYVRVPVQLIRDAKAGDLILIESGVGIAKVEREQTEEA